MDNIRRSTLSRLNDPNGCFNDYENEQLDLLQYDAHVSGECRGVPECVWCISEEANFDK